METVVSLKHNFPNSIQLHCFIHLKKNIQEKLRNLEYLPVPVCDIFGCQTGSVKEEGLIDSASEEFDSRLFSLENVWNEREKPFANESDPQFYAYFCSHVASVIKYVDTLEKLLV